MYCKVCGNLLEENDLICKVCGADIKAQQRQTANEAAFAEPSPVGTSETDSAAPHGDADGEKPFEARIFDAPETDPPQGETGIGLASETGAPEDLASERDTPEDFAPAVNPSENAASSEAAFKDDADKGNADPALDATAPKPAIAEFHWNIHKFPKADARKTEDVDFDWNMPPSSFDSKADSDLPEAAAPDAPEEAADESARIETIDDFFTLYADRKDDAAEETAESVARDKADAWRETDTRAFFAREDDAFAADGDAPVPSHAEPASDIFGCPFESDAEKSGRERFFTFDKKNAEFQKLLDREYERLQSYNSPIVNEAREMLAEWNWPLGFAGGRTDLASKSRMSSAFGEASDRDAGGGPDTPPASEAPREDGGFEAEETSPGEESLSFAETPVPADLFVDEETAPAYDAAFSAAEEAAAREAKIGYASDDGEEPAEVESGIAEQAPAEAGEAETAETPEASEVPAVTEAEISIGKALDSIEKEIKDWESRDTLSTTSKVVMVISAIFLILTGGSALVKHLAPHSPLDLWFDSVQLQAAVTIKHGVDTVKALFDDSDESDAESGNDAEDESGGEDGTGIENTSPGGTAEDGVSSE